jgi:hypothetical protein
MLSSYTTCRVTQNVAGAGWATRLWRFWSQSSSLEHAILNQDDQETICLAMITTQVTSLAALTTMCIVVCCFV